MNAASPFALADMREIADDLPVGIMLLSLSGRVMHVNKVLEQLTGFPAGEAPGLPCRHILRSGLCVAGCAQGCCPAKDAGAAAMRVETDLLTFKKRKTPILLSHFPVRDGNGDVKFFMDAVEDLTEQHLLRRRLMRDSPHGRFIGKGAAMERIAALIPRLAPTSAPVLISGETGTGKDILAEALHQASGRSREPFVRLSAGPLPEDMLMAEIFGQAEPNRPLRPGRFQQASGGTLYLSELADIPAPVQAGIAAFMDEGVILPVGARQPVKVDVRLIAATNRNPEDLLGEGRLDPGLFHRLAVARIALPPLRERREDIEFLLQYFLESFAGRFKKDFNGFSPEARAMLAAYDYPGNVRELKNIVEYAAMICPGGVIGQDFLPAHLAVGKPPRARKKRS